MSEEWERVRLGEVTTQVKDVHPVAAGKEYPLLGVRLYAEGPFLRETVTNQTSKATRFHRVSKGQFIYNRMFAWKGAFGVIPDALDGCFVSNEFPVFDCDESAVLADYLALWFQQPSVWDEVGGVSTGTTASRNRWKESQFEQYQIAIPPLPVQRRIVDLMAHLDNHLANLQTERDAADALLSEHRDRAMRFGIPTRAGDAFEVLIGRQRSPKRAMGPSMTPYLRAANIKDGHLDMSDVKEMDFDADEREKFGLSEGDVLVSEGSGSADAVGASARWSSEIGGPICFQNTLLRYRAIESVSVPSFVYHWCRWAHESGAFRETATGTNILHIGSTRAVEMTVNLPSVSKQEETCEFLDSLETSITSLEREIEGVGNLRKQLLGALLTGSSAVSSTYDVLLSGVA